MDTYEKIGNKIKETREKRGKNQHWLADQLSVSVSYVSHLERGKRKISIELLEQLADIFNVDLTHFLTEEDAVFLSNEEKAYLSFGQKMKEQGIDIKDVEKWVQIAKQLRDVD
ncbi:helix-turn-helix domain-containing protein [Alkalihalobacillus trypoxylicola]|uniref:HTH cro/C1-type domain-containing protein n=1 Tax=Alkalihalobacillus trypoxylicola TaxID=519424 RepID=A0A161PH81_9BACI|nr:helix-turn-helix transcriptional regulator [Alkalihalobacillus trypoxylicola]KYG28133.1 hypothetical protein AZF04_09525 [Alkalihalobacillus trypoxylicola]